MTPETARPARLTLLICLALTGNLQAEDVFHWIDDDGVMNFSQWAPDDANDVVKLVVNDSNPPGYDPQDDPYSIRNQALRINETWTTLAAQRDERREQDRDENPQPVRYQRWPADDHWYYGPPGFYGPIYRPIHRPIKPPANRPGNRPGHLPADRPVSRPHPHPHAMPAAPAGFSPDPMRSAHIGVRSNTSQ